MIPGPIAVGNKYGRLFVVSLADKKGKRGQRYFDCKCDCGNQKTIRGTSLKDGNTQSCGCLHKESLKSKLAVGEISYNMLEHIYKTGAAKRDYEFSLTREQFRNLIILKCHYCGQVPTLYNKFHNAQGTRINSYHSVSDGWAAKQDIFANGIDRVNNTLGYSISNCVPCCSTCNSMKLDMTVEEFVGHISKILNYFR